MEAPTEEQNQTQKQQPQQRDHDSQDSGLQLASQQDDHQLYERHIKNVEATKQQQNKEKATKQSQAKTKSKDINQKPIQTKKSKSNQQQKTEVKPSKKKLISQKTKFADQMEKEQETKNQRQQPKKSIQSNLQSPKKYKPKQKEQKPKQKEEKKEVQGPYDQEWTNQINSDDQEDNIRLIDQDEEQEQKQVLEQTAIIEEVQIQNLTATNQDQLNMAFTEKQAGIKFQHWVQNKHLLVLYLLFRKQIFDQFPKKKYSRIDIHPSNKNKIRIFGRSHEEIKQVSDKISQIIGKIGIIKLNIRREQAFRLKSSKLLNKKLLKDKMVIFPYGNSSQRSYFLGGKGTQPLLSQAFKQIRNYKFRYFRTFDFRNTRSYSVILSYCIRQKQVIKAFAKWNLKCIEIVPYIPSFNSANKKRQKQRNLCYLMTTIGTLQNFSPKQIQNNLAPFIKNNFFSITLVFKKGQKYLPKLTVPGIYFKYVFQKKFSWAYVFIICLKKQYFAKRQNIIKEIQKLAEKNIIFGARFFDNIAPQRSQYIKPQNYKEIKFPQNEPYSSSIISKRIEPITTQQKKQTSQQDKNEMKEKQVQEKIQQVGKADKQEKGFHPFDWKKHLLDIKQGEVKILQELNKQK